VKEAFSHFKPVVNYKLFNRASDKVLKAAASTGIGTASTLLKYCFNVKAYLEEPIPHDVVHLPHVRGPLRIGGGKLLFQVGLFLLLDDFVRDLGGTRA